MSAFFPASILTLAAGAVYGVVRGSILVSIASTTGAVAAFLVGRHLAGRWLMRRLDAYPRLKAVEAAVAKEGWRIVLLTRLSPAFPFHLLNYAYGLTRIGLGEYALASWAGMLPGTVMWVYLGSAAGKLARLGAGEGRRTPGEWALYAVGLAATAAATFYVTRAARKALDADLRKETGVTSDRTSR